MLELTVLDRLGSVLPFLDDGSDAGEMNGSGSLKGKERARVKVTGMKDWAMWSLGLMYVDLLTLRELSLQSMTTNA